VGWEGRKKGEKPKNEKEPFLRGVEQGVSVASFFGGLRRGGWGRGGEQKIPRVG